MGSGMPSDVTVLSLPSGHTITVRTRLTHGDERRAFPRMYTVEPDTGRMLPKLDAFIDTMICVFLLDWTVPSADGHPIDIRGASLDDIQAALDLIDGGLFYEIYAAVESHQARMLAAREEEKKTRSGSNGAGPILPLPLSVAGLSPTSTI